MNKKQNFTMVELLAVIVIIMILAGILIGGIGYATKKADIAKTQSKMTQLEVALDLFKTEYGYYPEREGSTKEGKVKFAIANTDGTDKIHIFIETDKFLFVKRGTTRPLMEIGTEGEWQDSWGNAFRYKCHGTHNSAGYDLWSYGPDGNPNTDDDICNWKRN